MPNYEFKDKQGKLHTIFFRMAEAPDLGAWIERDGVAMQRVLSVPQVDADVANRCRGYPYVSNQFPAWMTGASHTSDGRPIIESRRHEREFAARHGLKRD